MKLSHIAARNIRRNTKRSLLSITAIILAAMIMVMLLSLLSGILFDMKQNIVHYYTGNIQLMHQEYEKYIDQNPVFKHITNADKVITDLQQLEGVTSASGRINGFGQIYKSDLAVRKVNVLFTGLSFKDEAAVIDLENRLEEGRLPVDGEREALLGQAFAENNGYKVGDKISATTYSANPGPWARTFTVVGIAKFPVEEFNAGKMVIPFDQAQAWTRLGGYRNATTEIVLHLENENLVPQVKEAIKPILDNTGNSDISIRGITDQSTMFAFMSIAEAIYNMMGIVFFLLASTVIINTTMMVIFERTKEIGTYAAMGLKGKEIVKLFFMESGMMAVIGSTIGVLLGIGVTLALSQSGIDYSEAIKGMDIEMNPIFRPRLNVLTPIIVLITGIATASLASYFPAKRAAKIKPVEALRNDT